MIPMKWNWFKRFKAEGPPAFQCPKCDSAEVEYAGSGFWDGPNNSGGMFLYGTCKQCGSRIARWDNESPYVPSDEEWHHQVESVEEFIRQKYPNGPLPSPPDKRNPPASLLK